MSDKEEFVAPIVDRRESKPNVQLRSPFLNTFGSSSENFNKPKRNIPKTVIFALRVYPFRFDLNADANNEGQKFFNDFINEGLKRRNK